MQLNHSCPNVAYFFAKDLQKGADQSYTAIISKSILAHGIENASLSYLNWIR